MCQGAQARDAAVLLAVGVNRSGKREVLGVSVSLDEYQDCCITDMFPHFLDGYFKYPIQSNGQESDQALRPVDDHDHWDEGLRMIRPVTLAGALARMKLGYDRISSAELALSLTEGVSRVRFIRTLD